jgi:hypothetical protein
MAFSYTSKGGNTSTDSDTYPCEPCDHKRLKTRPRPKNYFCPRPECLRSQKSFWNKRDLAQHGERIHGEAQHFCSHHNCLRRRKGFTNEDSLLRHLREVHFERSSSDSNGHDTAGTDAGPTEPSTSKMGRQYYCAEEDSPAEALAELVYNIEIGTEEWIKVGGRTRISRSLKQENVVHSCLLTYTVHKLFYTSTKNFYADSGESLKVLRHITVTSR